MRGDEMRYEMCKIFVCIDKALLGEKMGGIKGGISVVYISI
jgi:hypothetical protein